MPVRFAFLHDVVPWCARADRDPDIVCPLSLSCTVACWACVIWICVMCRLLQVEAPPRGPLRPWVMRTAMMMCRPWKRHSGIANSPVSLLMSSCCHIRPCNKSFRLKPAPYEKAQASDVTCKRAARPDSGFFKNRCRVGPTLHALTQHLKPCSLMRHQP